LHAFFLFITVTSRASSYSGICAAGGLPGAPGGSKRYLDQYRNSSRIIGSDRDFRSDAQPDAGQQRQYRTEREPKRTVLHTQLEHENERNQCDAVQYLWG
jgi:hypothetical protein